MVMLLRPSMLLGLRHRYQNRPPHSLYVGGMYDATPISKQVASGRSAGSYTDRKESSCRQYHCRARFLTVRDEFFRCRVICKTDLCHSSLDISLSSERLYIRKPEKNPIFCEGVQSSHQHDKCDVEVIRFELHRVKTSFDLLYRHMYV